MTIFAFSRIDIGICLPNARPILDLVLENFVIFYLRPSSKWGHREHKDNMIILVRHTCNLFWFIITTFCAIILLRANGFSTIDFVYSNLNFVKQFKQWSMNLEILRILVVHFADGAHLMYHFYMLYSIILLNYNGYTIWYSHRLD